MPPLGMQTESVAKHVPYDPSIPPSLCSPSAAPRGGGGGKQGMAEGEDGREKRMLADERGGRQEEERIKEMKGQRLSRFAP